MAKNYNPLTHIPSAAAVQERLESILAEAAKLKILLRVARDIERVDDRQKGGAQ